MSLVLWPLLLGLAWTIWDSFRPYDGRVLVVSPKSFDSGALHAMGMNRSANLDRLGHRPTHSALFDANYAGRLSHMAGC